MNRTDELFYDIIETYQRHTQMAQNAKYPESRKMAEMVLNLDISVMYFLTQRTINTQSRLM